MPLPKHRLRLVALTVTLALVLAACDSGPSEEAICLEGVGQLQEVVAEYEEILDTAVIQMREENAPEKLEAISEDYSTLLEELEQMEAELPLETLDSWRLLASGVGMQESAWMAISEGLAVIDRERINDGARMISQSRDLLDESNLALPDCSAVD